MSIGVLLVGSVFLVWGKKMQKVPPQSQKPVEEVVETPKTENLDTSNWKTYRNEKYSFEIRYPDNWEIRKSAGHNSDSSVISLTSPETRKLIQDRATDSSCDLSVYYYPSVPDEPANKYNYDQAVTLEEMISRNPMIRPIGQAELGNQKATDVVWGGNGAYYTILAIRNSHLYKVSFCRKENKDTLSVIEKSIVRTFQFLK
ncbi:PsbP-related protein [Accumulibacter sp.]|uniref:PsbP-related protein n=1 Tax=Accumulibacter sp. TaxID=2053492 RepID=UPI0035AE33BF